MNESIFARSSRGASEASFHIVDIVMRSFYDAIRHTTRQSRFESDTSILMTDGPTDDANLMHDLVTGRSATGSCEFPNKTPIDWFSKRQNQAETATCGSEFMAARQATERLIDLRCTLRSFGVPLCQTHKESSTARGDQVPHNESERSVHLSNPQRIVNGKG